MKHYILKQGILTIFLWTILHLNLAGQKINTFTIDQPAEIAGDYTIAQAEWGDTSVLTLSAKAVFASPELGCEPYANDYTDKIVFIEKGTCPYDIKALNAQIDMAIAVVICNNNQLPTDPLYLIPPGDIASHVYIPVFLADKQTCDKLKIFLAGNGLDMSLSYKCAKPVYSTKVVWGHLPGQGDFSNGFDGWTVDKGWTYNQEGIIRKGAYTSPPRVIGSATACNGVAEFNSDHLDNNNDKSQHGLGPCPAPCTGSLISPVITLSSPLEALTISFDQSFRQFQSRYYLMVSKNGGLHYHDTIILNPESPVNSAHIKERKIIPIAGYEGVTDLRFKFVYEGNYYYWAIDDVIVSNEKILDLKIDRKWYSVAPYYKMPFTKVSEIPLMANINNSGNIPGTDVKMKVKINGPFTQDSVELLYGNFPADTDWNNKPFSETYLSPTTVGTYFAEYHISGNEEVGGPDNRVGFQWKVTNQTFGTLDSEEEFGSNYLVYPNNLIWNPVPRPNIYSCANVYYVPEGNHDVATKVRYGLENPLEEVENQSVRIDLFEWIDADNSGTASPQERKRVGCNIQVISSDIPNLRKIETDIWVSDEEEMPVEGERVSLKDDTHYIISVSVIPDSPETDPEMKLLGFTPRALDNYNRSIGHMLATNFALDSLEKLGIMGPRTCSSLQAWENIKDNSIEDIDKRNFRYIFNGPIYWKYYIEMDIEKKVSSQEIQLPVQAVKTFPNPAARDLFIDFNLPKASSKVDISFFDMEGKLMFNKPFTNLSDDRIKLDVSSLTNGVYNVIIQTDGGVATRKIVTQN